MHHISKPFEFSVLFAVHIVMGILLCLFLPSYSVAGAWTQHQGAWLVINNAEYQKSCRFWNKSGKLLKGPCFEQFIYNPYIEYGLNNTWTIGINPFFTRIKYAGKVDSFKPNNAEFFVRHQFLSHDWTAVSGQLAVNTPFTQKLIGNGSPTTAPFVQASREFYIDARGLLGTGGDFNKKIKGTWYTDLQGGFRQFFGGAASEIHVDATMAWKQQNNLLEIGCKSLNTITMHNPSGITQPNYNLFTLNPYLLYWVKPRIGIQVGLMQDVYGTNVGRSTTGVLSLWITS